MASMSKLILMILLLSIFVQLASQVEFEDDNGDGGDKDGANQGETAGKPVSIETPSKIPIPTGSNPGTRKNPKTGTNPRQGAVAPAAAPTDPKYFLNATYWSADFGPRFQRTISNLPKATFCSKSQANLAITNRLVAEINRFESQKDAYLRLTDYRAITFMGYQEIRLNRLGQFLYPITWSAVRCGAGVLTNDCGQPHVGATFPKTGQ